MPKKVKKVCLVTISLAKGGVERSVAQLSHMLDDLGHKVHIVTLNDAVDYEYSGQLFNLGKYKTADNNFLKRLLRFRKLRAYLVKNRFDFIIDHRPKNDLKREKFYLRYVYKGFRKIYVVHSSHPTMYLTDTSQNAQQVYQNNFATVAVSKYIEQENLIKKGITNAQTIYNAVDFNREISSEPFPPSLQNKKYLLAYGRIDEEVKDFSFLMDAYQASEVWKKNFYLVILGDGKDKDVLLQKATQMPCGQNILFLPFTNQPFKVVSKSHFVTLTSKFEGFPMVLAESLSLGIPVVSLDIVSGPSEIVKNKQNGLLVKERNPQAFGDAIKLMTEDQDLYNHCKNQAKSSVAHLSKEQIARQWDQLISM